MKRSLWIFFWFVGAALCARGAVCAEQPLLLIGQSPGEASFIGSNASGTIDFRLAEETRSIPLHDLVRWSTPRFNLDRREIVLTDGSRLALAESWAGKNTLQISQDVVTASTDLLGKVSLPRAKLRAILLNAPASSSRRTQLVDQLLAWQGKNDQLLLTNGDSFAGRLLEIETRNSNVAFAIDGTSEPITLKMNRVAGIACGSKSKPKSKGKLAVGLRDGSYLVAKLLIADSNSMQLELACGVKLSGSNARDIVHLQSLGPQLTYLSDLEPAEYRHEPFLNIPWPYARDRNVLGGPLSVQGNVYKKGLGVHSASWLTYDLPRKRLDSGYQRFAAQVAIDDSAGDGGSAIFQVFLRKKNSLQLAFETPIIRGGDAPLPISVDLADAEQLVLVVEYADRGDERDYANWLDARLE